MYIKADGGLILENLHLKEEQGIRGNLETLKSVQAARPSYQSPPFLSEGSIRSVSSEITAALLRSPELLFFFFSSYHNCN